MEKKTEIILNGTEETITSIKDLLDLKVGGKFYFSCRGITSHSEDKLRNSLTDFKKEIVDRIIENTKKRAEEYHIKEYEIITVTDGLEIDYSMSIEQPNEKFTRSISVKEV
jgi:hypothetical protein